MTEAVRGRGEFGLIEDIRRLMEAEGLRPDVPVGIGDDAAVLSVEPGRQLLAACDTLVADVHFRLRPEHAYDTGRKAVAVNASDIAAMGGRPTWALLGLAVPPDLPWPLLRDLLRGLRDEARGYGIALVGGDTVAAPRELALHVTVLGQVEQNRAVTRRGARPGDIIGVTGDVGASAAGFALLEAGAPAAVAPRDRDYVVGRHVRPRARVEAGRRLAEVGVTAMIDLSDGLAGDLRHVCEASGVGAIIQAERVPVAAATRRVAAALGVDPLRWALTGGEDYELLFTVSPERWDAAAGDPALPVTAVGRIVEAEEGLTVDVSGGRVPLRDTGFVHF